jgi:hypothetical protein
MNSLYTVVLYFRFQGDGESSPDPLPAETTADAASSGSSKPPAAASAASSSERSRNLSGQKKGVRFRLSSPVRFAPHSPFRFSVEVDALAVVLLVLACATRFYRLDEPRHIVLVSVLYIFSSFF